MNNHWTSEDYLPSVEIEHPSKKTC